MSVYVPLYKEVHVPSPTPEMLEKLKKSKSSEEQTWSRIVIDLTGDEIEDKTPYNQD